MPTGRRPPDTPQPEPEPEPEPGRPRDAVGTWRPRVGTLLEQVAAQRGLDFEPTPAAVTTALGGLTDTVEHLAAGMDSQQRRWLAGGLTALAGHVETTTLPDRPLWPRPVVAIVVVTAPLGVLIGRRTDEAPPWVFPGGPLKTGDTLEEGAARVYEQETGRPVTVEHEIGRHHHPATGSDTVYLAGTLATLAALPTRPPGQLAELCWADPTQVQDLIPDLPPAVRRYLHLRFPLHTPRRPRGVPGSPAARTPRT